MTDFPFAIVGFDLDGTLVDSNLDIAPAINHTLLSIGRDPVPTEETRNLIGGGSRLMLERALNVTGGPLRDDAEFESLFASMLAHYEDHIADNTVPYEGCLDALDELAAKGVKLAVATNKNERLARKLLDLLGMTDRFCSIMGGDTLGPGRAKPARDMLDETIARCGGLAADGRFAMVGDSTYDVRAARNAGWPVVAFSFGYNDVPVDELGGDALVDDYRDLVPALQRL